MGGDRLALIVATDTYEHPGLTRLRAPAADAQALAQALGDPQLGDFRVEVLRNERSAEICARIEDLLCDRDPLDLVLLHFSCHGLKDDSGELYLAATNTVPDRLASTAVDAALIDRLMRRSRARRVILLLDCCYGGAFERGVLARATGAVDVGDRFAQGSLGGGRGRVVITACTEMEYAFEGSTLADLAESSPSFFTGALAEGIQTGAADRDLDGHVSLSELYDYVYERVRTTTPSQTPSKWEFGLQGDLHIARNPFRVIAPASVPAEIIELIENERASVRMIAVQDLGRMLEGNNLPLAAAARLMLEDLQDNDSRLVAQAAAERIQQATLGLSASVIDLGQVQVPADEPVRRSVQVSGGPLALSSVVSSSSGQVRARLEGDTVRIEWSPTDPGDLCSTIRVSGPAGEAEVNLTGQAHAAGDPSAATAGPVVPVVPVVPVDPPTDGAETAPADEQPAAAGLRPRSRAVSQRHLAELPRFLAVAAVVFAVTVVLSARGRPARQTADLVAVLIAVGGVSLALLLRWQARAAGPQPVTSLRRTPKTTRYSISAVMLAALTAVGAAQLSLAVPAFALGSACTGDDPDEYLSGTVYVGINGESPGWSSGTPPKGFDIDFVEYIAKREGFRPRYRALQQSDREQALEQCTVNLVVSGYSMTPKREAVVDFAGPYYKDRSGVEWLSSKVKAESDGSTVFDTAKLCVTKGTTATDYLPSQSKSPVEEASMLTCMKRLFDPKDTAVQGVITDESILAGYRASVEGAEVSAVGTVSWSGEKGPINHEEYGIGMPDVHPELCASLTAAVTAFLDEDWSTTFQANLPSTLKEADHKPDGVDSSGC